MSAANVKPLSLNIPHVLVLFSGTWAVYAWYHRHIILKNPTKGGETTSILFWLLWCSVAAIGGYYLFAEHLVGHLLIPALITLAYITFQPLIQVAKSKERLANWKTNLLSWSKPINIAVAWSLACMPFPWLPNYWAKPEFLAHFLWILAIAILFEHKDKLRNNSLKQTSNKKTIVLSYIILIVSSITFYIYSKHWLYIIAALICIIVVEVLRKRFQQTNWYFYLLIDGLIFIPTLILWTQL